MLPKWGGAHGEEEARTLPAEQTEAMHVAGAKVVSAGVAAGVVAAAAMVVAAAMVAAAGVVLAGGLEMAAA